MSEPSAAGRPLLSAMPLLNAENHVIGVDLGGTAIKLGRFDAAGSMLAEAEVSTPQPAMPGAVSTAIAEAVEQLDPQHRAERVGIGLPGPTDAAGRIARLSINLPGWVDVPLADWYQYLCVEAGNCAPLDRVTLGPGEETTLVQRISALPL